MSAPTTFHPFPRLPPELRLAIWETSVEDHHSPVLTLHISIKYWKIHSTPLVSGALAATSESRNATHNVLKGQCFYIGCSNFHCTHQDCDRRVIYFNPKTMILELVLYTSAFNLEDGDRELPTWGGLFNIIGTVLPVTESLHLRCDNQDTLRYLWGGPDDMGFVMWSRPTLGKMNLNMVTGSDLGVEEINKREKHDWCEYISHAGWCSKPHLIARKCEVKPMTRWDVSLLYVFPLLKVKEAESLRLPLDDTTVERA